MTIDPLEKLMAQLLQLMAPEHAEEAKGLAAYIEAEAALAEKGADGNPTTKAHRARTRIRNRFFVEETNEKSRHKVEAQAFKACEKFAKTFGDAVLQYAKLRTHKRKLEMLDEHQSTRLELEKSREEHDPETAFALAFPLIETLMQEGASPSSIGRLPQVARVFIASLIKAWSRDPDLKDPANPWVLIARAGVLDGYHKDLPPDECKVLAYAMSQRSEATSEWAAKARSELDLPPGFSATFLEAAAGWADASKALDPGVARAYWEAHGLAIERDIELLGQVLGLDSKTDLMQLTVLSHYFHRVKPEVDDDLRYTIQLVAMKQAIDRIEPHRKYRGDWVRELVNSLPSLAQNLAGSIDSIEAFNLLFTHGLSLTEAREGFEDREKKRAAEEAKERRESAIREACELGVRFKIDGDFVVWEEDDGYEEIDTREWTGEDWLAIYGCLPGDDDSVDQPPAPDEEIDFYALIAEEDDADASEVDNRIAPGEENAPSLPTFQFENDEGNPDVERMGPSDEELAPDGIQSAETSGPAEAAQSSRARDAGESDTSNATEFQRARPMPLVSTDEEIWEDD